MLSDLPKSMQDSYSALLGWEGPSSFEHIKLLSKAALFFKGTYEVPHCLGTKGATSQGDTP